MSTVQTKATDFDEMFWPQLVRGAAIMFCILPRHYLPMAIWRRPPLMMPAVSSTLCAISAAPLGLR